MREDKNMDIAKEEMDIMKKILLILFLLLSLVACKEKVNIMKIHRDSDDGLIYVLNRGQPYTGKVISLYDNGNTALEFNVKRGRLNGKQIEYDVNKKIKETTYYVNDVKTEK